MIKERRWNIAFIIAVSLLSAVFSAKKADFGILTACVNKNRSLVIQCSYPACDNTVFNCDIYEFEGNTQTLIGTSNKQMVNKNIVYLNSSVECQLTIKNNVIYNNKIYKCLLSRRTSKEEKNITVKNFDKLKACTSSGLFLHGVSGLLWSIAVAFYQEAYF